MIKDLQVTLYEVFGYLLPGGIFAGALAVAFLALFFPTNTFTFDLHSTEGWVTVLALCYVSGHMAQAIANQVVKLWKWDETKIVEQLPQEIRDTVTEKLKAVVGEKATTLAPRWMYELCDDAVIRSGKIGEREIYVYREGFYRGVFVGSGLMGLACVMLLIRLWFENPHTVTIDTWAVTPSQLLFIIPVSAAFSYLALRRYWRFMDYRVRHSVLGYLTLQALPPEKKEKTNAQVT